MTISKKLFLMTAIALNLGSVLNAYNLQSIFNFAVTLSKEETNDAKVISNWLLQEINQEINTHNNKNIEHIALIINEPTSTPEKKVARLTQIKPSFIQKWAIHPLCNVASAVKKGLTFGIPVVAAIAVLPGLAGFSDSIGRCIARAICKTK